MEISLTRHPTAGDHDRLRTLEIYAGLRVRRKVSVHRRRCEIVSSRSEEDKFDSERSREEDSQIEI